MGSRLLCCVALCVLGAGPLDTAVFQTPKYLIVQVGNEESLRCEQKLGHNAMYWYKQDSKKLLKIMFTYRLQKLILNETVPSRFLPENPSEDLLKLQVNSMEPGDSAVYFCASSLDTALQSHGLPVHKPTPLAQPGTCGNNMITGALFISLGDPYWGFICSTAQGTQWGSSTVYMLEVSLNSTHQLDSQGTYLRHNREEGPSLGDGETVRDSDITSRSTNQGPGDQSTAPCQDSLVTRPLGPEATIGGWLLCCVALCLLGAVRMDTGVTQTPRHLVMGRTSRKSVKCEQHLGHNAMYWYKQRAQKPPELMFVFQLKKLVENMTVPSRFSPNCSDSSQLYLHLDGLEPEDSGVYLCASSKDTALQSHLLPVQKPPGSSPEAVGRPRCGSAFPVRLSTEISEQDAPCQCTEHGNAQCPAHKPPGALPVLVLNKTVPGQKC
ncbi:uncharacterized protein LOC118619714 [Molossus molossus]|uniref:uncharacterized protein LOC118619714 n=1 Tax=Molossus molossus TaxID=27622 RepID=UPI0017461FF4|nr:uncharacterized protein LOC118619714 [Molossus molossus]